MADPIDIYNMYLPVSGPWYGWGRKTFIGGGLILDACQGESGKCLFEVKGNPDHNALYNQVEAHETRHANDHQQEVQNILQPWDQKLQDAQGNMIFRRNTPEEAVNAVYQYAGGTPFDIADQLWDAWDADSRAFHQTDEGKTNSRNAGANDDCTRAWITVTVP